MVPLVRCLGAGSCPAVSLAPKDHLTRLCDSVRPASSQVQGHPPHSSEGSRCPWLVRGISVLLAKDVMVPVPPADMKAGFFSPYFIVPKKSGGLRPILVCASWTGPFISLLSRCSCRTASSDASVPKFGLQHWPEDPYFHVSILPCHRLRFAFEGRAYQYRSCPSGCPYRPVSSRK